MSTRRFRCSNARAESNVAAGFDCPPAGVCADTQAQVSRSLL
jgi:hypothetical protein